MKSNFLSRWQGKAESLFVSTGTSWSGLMKGATWSFPTELELYAVAAICPPLLSLWPRSSWRYVCKHTWHWKSALLQGGAGGRQGSSKRRWKNISRGTAMYLLPFFFFFNSRIMLYNAVLVSAIHQHEYVHQHSLPFWVSLLLKPHPILLGHHRVPSWTPCAIQHLPASFYFTHGSVLVSVLPEKLQCICSNAILSTGPTLSFPCCEHKSILYVWVSIPALQVHSFIKTIFSRFHTYALI